MSVERFDHIARLLAQGTSRRQILKGFAVGLGTSLFAALGLPDHEIGRLHDRRIVAGP